MIKNFFKTSNGSKYFLFLFILQLLSHNFIFFNQISKNSVFLLGFLSIFLFSFFYKNFYFENFDLNYEKVKFKELLLSL